MTCSDFLDRLEAFLDGGLSADDRAAAERHLSTCSACRDIGAVPPAHIPGLAPAIPSGLADSVLARTSGRPCQQARDLLSDHIDRLVQPSEEAVGAAGSDVRDARDAVDQDLLGSHLKHCPECTAVAVTLMRLSDDLATFAEADPSPELVEGIISATVARRRSWRGWWDSWAEALLGRSRLAWEAGYVGALLLWVLFGASWAPLRAAPAQALAFVQQNPVQQVVVRLGEGGVWEATGGRAVGTAQELGADVAHRYERAAVATSLLRERVVELRDAALALDVTGVYDVLMAISADLEGMWTRFWSEPADGEPLPETES